MALSSNAAGQGVTTTWVGVVLNALGVALHYVGVALHYIFTGKWIVDAVRWLIETGGNVAESAFLLATVYVTVNTVAHQLVLWVLPLNAISTINQVSVIAFSVLPELIIFSAMKVTFDHCKVAFATRRVAAWAWSIAYALPTLVFLVMTIATITSFVSLEAVTTNAPQATGAMLVVRCLAGWWYGMVQMLFSKLGKRGYSDMLDALSVDNQMLNDTVKNRDAEVTGLKSELATLQERVAVLDQELIDARIACVNKKVLRSRENATAQSATTTEKSATPESSAILAEQKRQRLKEQLQSAILRGDKLNLKKVAADASVSYGMARKHAQAIIDELATDRNTDKLHVVRPVEEESA